LVSLYGHHWHCPSLSRFAVEHVGTYERKKDLLSLSQVFSSQKKSAARISHRRTQVSMSNEKSGKQKKKPRQLPVVPNRRLQLDRVMHLDAEPPTLKRSRRLLLFTYIDAALAHIRELICVVWMCARRLFAVLTVGPIAPCHLFAVR
jgi:hypothetical protein